MFSTILVGADDQPGGRDAIALARALASPGSDLILVHVRETLEGVAAAALGSTAPVRAGRELLERARRELGRPYRVITGEATSAAAGLHRAAEEANADLLVVGSCARQGVDRVLLGDETRGALHGAPCAVAVAPRGFAGRSGALRRVGVAYQATSEGHEALRAARRIADEQGAELEATIVLSGLPTAWAAEAAAYREARDVVTGDSEREARQRLDALGDLVGHVVWGSPVEELVRASQHADMLVLGSRGSGPLRRLLFGSTADALVRDAACAVLVVTRATQVVVEEPPAKTAHVGA